MVTIPIMQQCTSIRRESRNSQVCGAKSSETHPLSFGSRLMHRRSARNCSDNVGEATYHVPWDLRLVALTDVFEAQFGSALQIMVPVRAAFI